jgi:hypothetical protein
VADASERPNPFSLADPDVVTEILEAAGFVDVTFADSYGALFYGVDIAAALEWILGFSYISEMLNRSDPVVEERAVRLLHETLAAHTSDDGVWFDSRAWIVSARRP